MKTRICDRCQKPITGPRHMVIPVGKPGQVFDICPLCMASFMTTRKPSKTRRLYDIPLDDSPANVNVSPAQIDGVLGLAQENSRR